MRHGTFSSTQHCTIRYLWDKYRMDFYSRTAGIQSPSGICEAYSQLCLSAQDNTSLFNAYTQMDFRNTFYQYVVKPIVPLMLFSDMVGEEKFLTPYRAYIRRWEGKHPIPFDLFYTMNDVLGENFNWFWNAWYIDFGYPDLGIEFKDNRITVKRIGARALPLPLTLTIDYNDGTSAVIARPMDIWKNGSRQIEIEIESPANVKTISLDTENVPDIDPSNHLIYLK